jgi:uncharacterized protein (TIGR03083 family)
MTVTSHHVRQAAAALREALEPGVDADWQVPAGDLDWTVWETGVHVADDQVFYATQLIAQPTHKQGYTPFEVAMWDEAKPEGMLRTIEVCAEILARIVETTPPDARGFHNYGISDAEGFAAMGAIETMIHAYDMATGLGVEWRPPGDLSATLLARLFPDAPDGDPADVLLWCCGRASLGDLERRMDWRWDGRPHTDR